MGVGVSFIHTHPMKVLWGVGIRLKIGLQYQIIIMNLIYNYLEIRNTNTNKNGANMPRS